MWKKLAALVSASSLTYLLTFGVTSLAFFAIWIGPGIAFSSIVWPDLLFGIGVTGATGLLATSAVSVLRREQIAKSTVGRWLRSVAWSGSLHSATLFALAATGLPTAGWTQVVAMSAFGAVGTSLLLIRRGKFGLLGAKKLRSVSEGATT